MLSQAFFYFVLFCGRYKHFVRALTRHLWLWNLVQDWVARRRCMPLAKAAMRSVYTSPSSLSLFPLTPRRDPCLAVQSVQLWNGDPLCMWCMSSATCGMEIPCACGACQVPRVEWRSPVHVVHVKCHVWNGDPLCMWCMPSATCGMEIPCACGACQVPRVEWRSPVHVVHAKCHVWNGAPLCMWCMSSATCGMEHPGACGACWCMWWMWCTSRANR
jgi:hypothetical protein